MSISAFPYFGSKLSLLPHILKNMPEHDHYIEPFGGSAAVLLNKPRSKIETYNDLDGDVVNFFRVLRERPEELARAIELTPYSRAEYDLAKNPPEGLSDLERARLLLVKIRQGFNATTRTYTGWRREKTASRGRSCSMSWINSSKCFGAVVERLSGVQLENKNALQLIQDLDFNQAFFYIDPPYVLKTRNWKKAYACELADSDHVDLAKLLSGLEGKAMVSGYNCELYDELFDGWYRVDIPVKINSSKADRVESLWMNYEPPSAVQLGLFDVVTA